MQSVHIGLLGPAHWDVALMAACVSLKARLVPMEPPSFNIWMVSVMRNKPPQTLILLTASQEMCSFVRLMKVCVFLCRWFL